MKVSGLKAMLKNRLNREDVYSKAEFWDAKTDEYDGTAVSGWANQTLNTYYEQRELDLLHANFPRLEGMEVLDIGCGTGRMSRYLAARGAAVLGIDFSPKAIAMAQQQGPAGNPAYRVLGVFELDEPGRFDIVLSFGCLSVACVDRGQLSAALTNIFRSLKPGGKLLLVEPIHRGLLHLVLNMNVREFLAVMREVGFVVEDVKALHFWPIIRPMAYVNLPRIVTAAGYQVGEWILKLTGRTRFGDYRAILASRPKP